MATGVPGLDAVVGGGFVEGHTYLVVGKAGTGKTLMSLQWLREGLRQQDRSLYVTLAETWPEIESNASTLAWSLDGIAHADLSPSGQEMPEEYSVFSASEVEKTPMWKEIVKRIEEFRPQRLVLDSLTHLRYLSVDLHQFRRQLIGLVNYLNARSCTTLMLFEPDELVHETSAALAVNGVIRLRSEISPGAATGLRSVQVEKMRGSDFIAGAHPVRLGRAGHTVYPHLIEQVDPHCVAGPCLPTGVAGLDELLAGGIESGTTTLLSGPAGAGKTTLGTHFLVHHSQALRGAIFTFEESAALLASRARNTGAPIDKALASGALHIHRVNPLELYPDEFLARVRHAVEVDHCKVVMIDSLRGYAIAMEEFGSAQAHVHNLVAYLTRKGVTTVLVSEVENIAGSNLVAADMGVSHLADNIILMRYAEDAGRVIKVVGCLKKRASGFEPELRELRISASGLQVGAKLRHLRGILTGVPTNLLPAAA
ncbi:MAG TPA: ATPase domain-containing protein [Usitatibacter sp.]|nr:ATPase domain-containing protein [Usitatibacter sp.]